MNILSVTISCKGLYFLQHLHYDPRLKRINSSLTSVSYESNISLTGRSPHIHEPHIKKEQWKSLKVANVTRNWWYYIWNVYIW